MSARRALIADDSPLVLQMIEQMLTAAGFEVVKARDGLEAIEQAFAQQLSLVVLDVMMPRMTGYQACRLLKSEPATRDVPVILLTSRDQAGDRFWGMQTGADHYVTKDEAHQRLPGLVEEILSGSASAARPHDEGHRDSVDILSRVNELLDRKLREATILSEIGRVARKLVQVDESFTSVMAIVARVVDFSVGGIAFVDGDDLHELLLQRRPVSAAVMAEVTRRLREEIGSRHPQPFGRVQSRHFPPSEGGGVESSLGGFLVFPLETGAQLKGLLVLAGRGADHVDRETLEFLPQVANQAYIVTENSRLFDRVRNLSMRDSLTELFNHRHTMELLNAEFQRVGRYEGGVSVVMVDLDDFKKINDGHGHQAGDFVLRETARVMKRVLRTVDVLGRYGGEEFLAILPQTDREAARQTAERLRVAIAEHEYAAAGRRLRITASLGVATYPSKNIDSPGSLIRVADERLYRAKEDGKNRVE